MPGGSRLPPGYLELSKDRRDTRVRRHKIQRGPAAADLIEDSAAVRLSGVKTTAGTPFEALFALCGCHTRWYDGVYSGVGSVSRVKCQLTKVKS